MRLRDYVRKIEPCKVCEQYTGGVFGCPGNYEGLEHVSNYCEGGSKFHSTREEMCRKCWDREFEEKEPERKVEIDVNDVIIAVATLCMKKEEREKTLNTFKVFEKYGVKPMDAIKLMEEVREVMK